MRCRQNSPAAARLLGGNYFLTKVTNFLVLSTVANEVKRATSATVNAQRETRNAQRLIRVAEDLDDDFAVRPWPVELDQENALPGA